MCREKDACTVRRTEDAGCRPRCGSLHIWLRFDEKVRPREPQWRQPNVNKQSCSVRTLLALWFLGNCCSQLAVYCFTVLLTGRHFLLKVVETGKKRNLHAFLQSISAPGVNWNVSFTHHWLLVLSLELFWVRWGRCGWFRLNDSE